MEKFKIAMMLFMMIILSGCSENEKDDEIVIPDRSNFWRFYYLNNSWVSCAWEELVEFVDADGKKVKIINRFKSVPADEESIRLLDLPYYITVCNLYLNDNKIEDFLLLCPYRDSHAYNPDFRIPVDIKLLHAPSWRESVIYSFDNWEYTNYIEYRIVGTNPSSNDLTETHHQESPGEYINLIDWYSGNSHNYIGWGYINDLGYERCGLIGDLTGPYPRVHIMPSDAPRNAKYTLLGLKYIPEYQSEYNYLSTYLNPDYQTLVDGAEYVVAPDAEWPDMSDTSDPIIY